MGYGRQEPKRMLMAPVKESDMAAIKAFLKKHALDDENAEVVRDFCLELHKWTADR